MQLPVFIFHNRSLIIAEIAHQYFLYLCLVECVCVLILWYFWMHNFCLCALHLIWSYDKTLAASDENLAHYCTRVFKELERAWSAFSSRLPPLSLSSSAPHQIFQKFGPFGVFWPHVWSVKMPSADVVGCLSVCLSAVAAAAQWLCFALSSPLACRHGLVRLWLVCWDGPGAGSWAPSFSGNRFNRFAAVLRNYDPLDYSYGIFWDVLDTVSYCWDCEMKDKMKDSAKFADWTETVFSFIFYFVSWG